MNIAKRAAAELTALAAGWELTGKPAAWSRLSRRRACSGAICDPAVFEMRWDRQLGNCPRSLTMSLGTAISILGLSLAVRYARERTIGLFCTG